MMPPIVLFQGLLKDPSCKRPLKHSVPPFVVSLGNVPGDLQLGF